MPSSLIGALARHCEDSDLPHRSAGSPELFTLAEVLGDLPDPRRVRGRRYRLGSLLALCLVAVLGGARSLAQISRFAADSGPALREVLGMHMATPNASMLGRLLSRLDGDAVDDAVGAWLARHPTDPVDESGDTLVGLAVDGKAVRGSRTADRAVHLLAAALHGSQTVIAQRQVEAKSNEIPAFAPLLNRLDLRGVVVTADAMHTQRGHAKKIVAAGGHYLLVVKGIQKRLRNQARAKDQVQDQLAEAQHLLDTLTEQARAERRRQEAEASAQAARTSHAQDGPSPAPGTGSPAASGQAAKAFEAAKTRLGKPYVWGATGPDSFDCSGLTMWAYTQAGITIPRTSNSQDLWIDGSSAVARDPAEIGKLVLEVAGGDGVVATAPDRGEHA
ncbi:cell wall-associated NlpC family hydrolase [Streptacidiphilus sp. MAP12-33]|uniref:ISAs1 family transposase n=1 Tax=Streptacidiphilus sp. MAP12-33 TaxID=3156266 RepID=UPI0035149ABD